MNDKICIKQEAISAWIKASKQLGFKIEAPYYLNIEADIYKCFAYLPDYGSENGMIIDSIMAPAFSPTQGLSEASEKAGLYYSSINIELYRAFEAALFKETLLDWGFFGDVDCKPSWMNK